MSGSVDEARPGCQGERGLTRIPQPAARWREDSGPCSQKSAQPQQVANRVLCRAQTRSAAKCRRVRLHGHLKVAEPCPNEPDGDVIASRYPPLSASSKSPSTAPYTRTGSMSRSSLGEQAKLFRSLGTRVGHYRLSHCHASLQECPYLPELACSAYIRALDPWRKHQDFIPAYSLVPQQVRRVCADQDLTAGAMLDTREHLRKKANNLGMEG